MTAKKSRTLLIIAIACLLSGLGLYWRAESQRTLRPVKAISTSNLPQRIVSLAPDVTEILFELGLGERVAAVSDDSDWPLQAKEKKKIGAFFRPSTEAIIACKPDLVITLWFSEQKTVAESLRRLGYNVLTVELQRMDQLGPVIEEIGRATGTEMAARKLVEKINGRFEQLKNKYNSPIRPKALWLVQDEPVRVAGRDTFINEMLELAGGQNAIGPTLMQYPQLGSEQILASGAEVIIHSAMSKGNLAKEQQAAEIFWRKYPLLPAVKNNKIFVIDPDTTLRMGPRLGDGVELIGRLLHPEK